LGRSGHNWVTKADIQLHSRARSSEEPDKGGANALVDPVGRDATDINSIRVKLNAVGGCFLLTYLTYRRRDCGWVIGREPQ